MQQIKGMELIIEILIGRKLIPLITDEIYILKTEEFRPSLERNKLAVSTILQVLTLYQTAQSIESERSLT